MGNNSAFSNFEAVILAVYNKGALDRELLKTISECFQDQDADAGGYSGELAKDGKELYEIVAFLSGEKVPARPNVPKDYRKRTEAQEDAWNDYWESLHDIFDKVTGL